MKVLRVIARLNVGGPARHVVLLDRGLRARGHETLLVHGTLAGGEASFEHLGHDANLPMVNIPHLGRRISPVADFVAFAALLRVLFRYRPDVVHTHTAKAGALGRLAAWIYNVTRPKARRAAVVHTFHGHVFSGYFGALGSLLVRVAERALAHLTDRIVVISRAQRRDVVDRFRIAAGERVAVVELGLDLEPMLGDATRSDLRARLGIPHGAFVVGYVGRLVPIKDVQTLVRAVAAARASVPALTLLVAGNGPERSAIEGVVRELELSTAVRWLGWVEDLASMYAAIDLCAISSLNEGTPVALIEAMAAGRPVVATAVGGVPDIVEEGHNGLLVAPADVGALAAAIIRLAGDRGECRRLGQAGQRIAAARFSCGRLVDDIERLYETVTASHCARVAVGS